MQVQEKNIKSPTIKFFIQDEDKEIARLYLYIMKNDLHKEPFAYIEDLFVNESYRGKGLASKLLDKAIDKAKEIGCYKIVCTSRYGKDFVHKMYLDLGFKDHGKTFRLDI